MKFIKIMAGHYSFTNQVGVCSEKVCIIKNKTNSWTITARVTDSAGITAHDFQKCDTMKECKEIALTLLEQVYISLQRKQRLEDNRKQEADKIVNQLIDEILQEEKQPKPLFKTNAASVKPVNKQVKSLQASDNPTKFLNRDFIQIHHVYKSGLHVTCKPGYHYRLNKGNSGKYQRVNSILKSEFPHGENVQVVNNKTGKVAGFIRL